MFKKILVPVDGTEYSDLAITKAKSFAEDNDCEIILIHVIDNVSGNYHTNPYKFSRELVERIYHENQLISYKILENAKKELDSLGDRVNIVHKEGVVYDVIIDYAETIDADLIIMGSKGTNGLRNLLGSVTRKVAIGSNRSVLIVR